MSANFSAHTESRFITLPGCTGLVATFPKVNPDWRTNLWFDKDQLLTCLCRRMAAPHYEARNNPVDWVHPTGVTAKKAGVTPAQWECDDWWQGLGANIPQISNSIRLKQAFARATRESLAGARVTNQTRAADLVDATPLYVLYSNTRLLETGFLMRFSWRSTFARNGSCSDGHYWPSSCLFWPDQVGKICHYHDSRCGNGRGPPRGVDRRDHRHRW